MFCTTYRRPVFAGAIVATLVAACVAPALAVFTHQQTVLSGPAISGQVPQGDAQLNQSAQPHAPGRLVVNVRDVSLPNGTRLNVTIDGRPVGVLTLNAGVGNLSAPIDFQVGRLSRLDLALESGALILSGATPWQVPWPAS